MSEASLPTWPPGLWRRIVLIPGPGAIVGALEDDVHRFHLRIDHADGAVNAVAGEALRYPMTGCPGAPEFLAERLLGRPLAAIAAENAREHCTHLYDLAVLCAAHVGDTTPSRFDLKVADRVEGRTTALAEVNGAEALRWQLDGTAIVGPEEWAGRDLKGLGRWQAELSRPEAELAAMLRRAILVSGARAFAYDSNEAAVTRSHRMGACFNYSLPVAKTSYPVGDWRRDWSTGSGEPLGDFDPASAS